MEKKSYQSKLMWLGLIMTVLGVITTPEAQQYIGTLIPAEWQSKIMAGAGLLIMVLRAVTNSGVTLK